MEHFFKALRYSRDGFLALLKEQAFRQELALLVVALAGTGFFCGAMPLLDVLPWGLLVLITEALNTGIEKTVDLCTMEWNELAKKAKDCGSFACGLSIAVFLLQCAREVLKIL